MPGIERIVTYALDVILEPSSSTVMSVMEMMSPKFIFESLSERADMFMPFLGEIAFIFSKIAANVMILFPIETRGKTTVM